MLKIILITLSAIVTSALFFIPAYKVTLVMTGPNSVILPSYYDVVVGTRTCKPYRGRMEKYTVDSESSKSRDVAKIMIYVNSKRKGIDCLEHYVDVINKNRLENIELLAMSGNKKKLAENDVYGEFTGVDIIVDRLQKDNYLRYIMLALVLSIFFSTLKFGCGLKRED